MVDVRRNPELTDVLWASLLDTWVAVTAAGGAVGFVPPVTADDVRPTAEAALEQVRRGRADLAAVVDDDRVVAFGFLEVGGPPAVHAHLGTVKRLQRHPDARGRRLGAAVLAELESAAADRGLQRLTLTVRAGTGRERFYLANGYHLDAVLPGRLRLGEGLVVDELHLSKVLHAGDEAGACEVAGVLRLHRLDPGLPLPTRAHPGDAGLDLRAREPVTLAPGERALVPTGVAVALPRGTVGLLHPRSGLALRHGVGMVNAPGTVDQGYRGELKVVLINLDPHHEVTVERGDRVGQLLVQRVEQLLPVEVDELGASARGGGGFGSSGR